MAPRVRPATTLLTILLISFAFQLIAILTVPVTKTFYLSSFQGYKFGVFGLCNGDICSGVRVGYSASDIDGLQGFTLPSNARHSVSKLLIVHPIAAGFTFILVLCTIVLHWHGPSSSLRFLFFVLLWTIPTFLLTLLSFLVDILLFIPHLSWCGWLVLASAVIVAICAVFLCIMRRTVSSRKSMKKIGRVSTFDDGYQMRPLNYGVGTVDDMKNSDDEDESKPFVADTGYNTGYFNNSLQVTRTDDDLNNIQSTQPFNAMVSDAPGSPSKYDTTNILTPLQATYRGYEEQQQGPTNVFEYRRVTPTNVSLASQPAEQQELIQPSAPITQAASSDAAISRAPYPIDIPTVDTDTHNIVDAPYPVNDPYAGVDLDTSSVSTKPQGPRPMPSNATVNELSSAQNVNKPVDDYGFVPEANPAVEDPDVKRQLTFRTKIAQTLDELQPEEMYSNPSFSSTQENLLGRSRASTLKQAVEYSSGESDEEDAETVEDISAAKDSSDGLIARASLANIDSSSSFYSSTAPSEIPTPKDLVFSSQKLSYQPIQSIPEDIAVDHSTPSTEVVGSTEYPLPDPNERRTTPAPSFTNASILSSTFTSVSQREINPKYLEKNEPEEYRRYLQRQLQQKSQAAMQQLPLPPQPPAQSPSVHSNVSDLLIASNPDFSVGVSPKRGKKL